MQIDFNAAFNIVIHQGILGNLWSVGIGGSMLSIFTRFLSNRSQHVMVDVDYCLSKLVDIVSGLPQGCVFRPVVPCVLELFSILENMLIGYVDCSNLMAVSYSSSVIGL